MVRGRFGDRSFRGVFSCALHFARLFSPLRSASRLVHLHHDQPGVMSRLNGVLAAAGLNVTQMHLETAASMGAAVVDLNAPLDAATLAEVQRVDGSVRAFVARGGVAS